MKAIVYHKYGPPDVLKLEDVEKPVPNDNEVLIKVQGASVNAADWHMMRGDPFFIRFMSGLRKPKNQILGIDIAGRIEAVGGKVTRFKPGDEVFGLVNEQAGKDSRNLGSFAEYACVLEDNLDLKPAKMTFKDASAVPAAAMTALQGLRGKGRVEPGQKVLIHGASGGVGSFAVQIAKCLKAEVTGVCSTRNLDMVRSLGADHVVDYTREDFAKNGQKYDLILAINGNRSIFHYTRALNPGGNYIFAGGSMAQFFQALLLGPWISMAGNKKVGWYVTKPDKHDLSFLKELLEAGKIKPVIDKSYKLSEVPDAIRYVEEEHARGKVVVTV